MEKIKASSFYQAWIETVQSRKEDMLSLWKNPKGFTSYIKGSENSVIAEIGRKLDLKTYEQDYYSMDAIFYKEEDRLDIPNKFWFRDFRIAFEHENNIKSGIYQEVAHLLTLSCDVRVVVIYPEYAEDILPELHNIIKGHRQSNIFSEEESFLIICGYYTDFGWEGYIFKNKDWKKI